MTNLSPAAKAIDFAVYGPGPGATRRDIAAAALEAAADQVEPDDGISAEVRQVLNKILAIATELKDQS